MHAHLHFTTSRKKLVDRILIPKFYDPDLTQAAKLAADQFELFPLGDLLQESKAGSQLGVWLPRQNYGSGTIPFVRTSDLFHWRIRPDFKKGVSEEVYEEYRHRIDVQKDDLLMVAHGSYLIGERSTGLITAYIPLLISDYVFRLRLRPNSGCSPESAPCRIVDEVCKAPGTSSAVLSRNHRQDWRPTSRYSGAYSPPTQNAQQGH